MKLINRDKIEIPRQRERLLDGLIFVPLADVEAALDAAPVVFDEGDVETITAALKRQVRRPVVREYLEEVAEDRRTWLKCGEYCPTCKAGLKKKSDHCPDCGQALDWEVDDR